MIAGIDYGSKMAGTTVIAFEQNNKVVLIGSKKNQDADQMILDFVDQYRPLLIGLDAPLSLPGVYLNPDDYDDYFYRACDKEVRAMSPMCLGGLTARAMKLKSIIGERSKVVEVYPGMIAKHLELKAFSYKQKEADYSQMISKLSPWINSNDLKLSSSHQFDAVLALYIAKRYSSNSMNRVGEENEGFIYY